MRVVLPLLVLLAYGVAFAAAALGMSVAAFDDHPGQLYRVWHVVRLGPAPWAWNDGWWTGYPELQFYPPAFAYAAALLHALSLGALSVPGAYQLLLWLTYLAPGVTSWLLLTRLLGSGWLALPGAFVALTLSLWPTLMSGVEGGVRVGMAPARLAWSLLPLIAAALLRWSDGAAPFPARSVVPLIAVLVLTHPAHLPAAVVIVWLAAVAMPERGRRLATALGWLGVAALLTAFWTLPLIARAEHTRALAWGTLTLQSAGAMVRAHPLSLAAAGLAIAAAWTARSAAERAVTRWPWVMAAVVAVDAAVLERLGVRWLPADRVLDGFWLALVLAAGLCAGRRIELRAALRPGLLLPAVLAAVLAAIALSVAGESTFTLRARASDWPSYATIERGARLPALWAALRAAPPGRVLFVRSGIPLVYGTEWWRPHTHVTGLTPLTAGRAIVNGTFTHPSPVAALVYRGDAGPGPITQLVERLDGRSLFGRPLEELDAAAFNAHARRLGVSVVVALDEDAPALRALADNPVFARRRDEPPFVIWLGAPAVVPERADSGGWRVTLDAAPEGWTAAGIAYYPLWRASAGGRPLATRRDAFAGLEVMLPPGRTTVALTYAPGAPEWTGIAASVAGLGVWLAAWRRRAPRSASG